MGSRQSDLVDMLVDVEIRHILPLWNRHRKSALDHSLAESIEHDPPTFVDGSHGLEIEGLLREHDAWPGSPGHPCGTAPHPRGSSGGWSSAASRSEHCCRRRGEIGPQGVPFDSY